LQSSGFPLLDQAAVSQLRHGAFSPAMRAGQPVDSVFNLGVPFSLRSKQ
jgi:outer membrane biosynthesis protein TonB